jgi:hypothetical protein
LPFGASTTEPGTPATAGDVRPPADTSPGSQYELIRKSFSTEAVESGEIHAVDFDDESKTVRETADADGRPSRRPGASGETVGTTFILLRVAPFNGTNPFDFLSVRSDVEAARTPGTSPLGSTLPRSTPPGPGPINACTPGPLVLASALPLVPAADAQIDVAPATRVLRILDGGATAGNTALVASLPAMDMTRFTAGPGFAAVSPGLPADFPAGAPPQTFVLRRSDSGDFYRLSIMLHAPSDSPS